MTSDSDQLWGPAARRGPLRDGERVQLTDHKGRMRTIQLRAGEAFHTHFGALAHDDVIGHPDGSVVTTAIGREFLVLRPLLSDYVLGMPRGATIVYPKDSGQIVQMGDIFDGAVVAEAGVGSGGLAMSLLGAIGPRGRLISVERREDFAGIAKANVDAWFGGRHPAWEVHIGDLADVLPTLDVDGGVDRMVLDMLAPWENIAVAEQCLVPGGVLLAYVATATQMSRYVEDLRASERFTEPQAWESMVRTWHLEGLAVRPDHRMVAHTGFLVSARLLSPGTVPPDRARRPAPGAYSEEGVAGLPGVSSAEDPGSEPAPEWTAQDLGERTTSDRKVKRVVRDLRRRAAHDEATRAEGTPGPPVGE
ncbi:MAG TPA: tRNA (adenine-N1)-methyltransferase [Actinomycetaceae bacterium]|nr:tRNA (adenine-N1)-methyltransferase [Actinomycetaceae bacterium]